MAENWRLTGAKKQAEALKIELVGRVIVDVVVGEVADEPVPVLVLDNGTRLTPSRDDEGNGAGTLFVESK